MAPLPGGLAKAGYDPDQPRDAGGRWTDSSSDAPAPGSIADVNIMGDPNNFSYPGSQTGAAVAAAVLGGAALAAGGAAAAETLFASAAAAALTPEATVTIADAVATLPEGMSRATFGRLAGFVQGQAASSLGSTEATAEVIARLQSAGVTSQTISTFQRLYAGVASANPGNLAAVHRAALLANILKVFR